MLKFTRRALAVSAALTLGAASAQAATFNLNGVTFTTTLGGSVPAGTLTGSFMTNDALTAITGFDITAAAAGNFAGFRYTSATATVSASSLPSQYFQLDSAGSTNELRLYFTTPLTQTGATFNPTSSYESEPSGGIRFLTGAAVAAQTTAAVPEPASWAMLILGMGAVGYAMRRRVRASEVRFDAKIKRIAAGEA